MSIPSSGASRDLPNESEIAQAKRLAVPVDDACEIIGVGRTKMYELIDQGRVKSITIGRRRLVVYASLEALVG